jgi:quinol monooxygenase YgiN
MWAMPLLVHAEIHGLAGRARELRELLIEHAGRLAAAPGGLGAGPYEPVAGEPGEFVLDAWWSDEPALRSHYATPEYADYARRIGELLARPSDVTIHTVERSYRPTGDASLDPLRQD